MRVGKEGGKKGCHIHFFSSPSVKVNEFGFFLRPVIHTFPTAGAMARFLHVVIALLVLAVRPSASQIKYAGDLHPSQYGDWMSKAVNEMITIARSGHGRVSSNVHRNRQASSGDALAAFLAKYQDLSDPIWSMPVSGYINVGRTHTNSTANPQNAYTQLSDNAHTAVVYFFNVVRGGVILNGSRYLYNDIAHNDGGDCDLMKITYQHMVDVEGAQFLLAPINPDCSVLSKFAESRGILFMNAGDYSLLIVRHIENYTTSYDIEAWSQAYNYQDLEWTINLMVDQSALGASCADALTDPTYIDQTGVAPGSPPRRVRTAVYASNRKEVPYNVATQKAAFAARNVTELYPEQDLDLKTILTEQCSYLDPIIDQWQKAAPDFAMLITGASNGSIGMTCLHKRHYQPPALVSIVADGSLDLWHTAGQPSELPFIASVDVADPVFGLYSVWAELFSILKGYTPTFYEDTFAAAQTVLLGCINSTQSLDGVVVRECLRRFNGSTVFGTLSFAKEYGYAPNRPNVCLQKQTNGTFLPVYPADYPGRVAYLLPFEPFPWNATWEAQFAADEASKRRRRLLIAILVPVILVVVLGAIAGVVIYIFRTYHIAAFPKTATDQW